MKKESKKRPFQTAKMMSTIAHMESAALASMKEHGEGITHGPELPGKHFKIKQFVILF